MTPQIIDNYRLTSLEEPSDEVLAPKQLKALSSVFSSSPGKLLNTIVALPHTSAKNTVSLQCSLKGTGCHVLNLTMIGSICRYLNFFY